MPTDVSISFSEEDDSECASISITSIGSVSELRFDQMKLRAVAQFSQSDIRRILAAIQEAETKRIDPDRKTIECLEHLTERLLWTDEDPSRLQVRLETEVPIASCGAVRLEPILDYSTSRDGEK